MIVNKAEAVIALDEFQMAMTAVIIATIIPSLKGLPIVELSR